MKLNLLLINMYILPRKIILIYFLIFSQFYQTKFIQIHVGGQIHSRSQIRSLLSTFDTFICTKLHSKVSEISSESETTLLSLIYAPKRKCISLSHIDCCYQFSLRRLISKSKYQTHIWIYLLKEFMSIRCKFTYQVK